MSTKQPIELDPLDFDIIQMTWEQLQAARRIIDTQAALATKYKTLLEGVLARLAETHNINLDDYAVNLTTKRFEPKS